MRYRLLLALVIGVALPGLVGCTSTEGSAEIRDDTTDVAGAGQENGEAAGDRTEEPAPPLEAAVQASVEQIAVTGTEPGTELELRDGSGGSVGDGPSDDQGSLLFRLVEPGEGYTVVSAAGASSEPITVMDRTSGPDQSLYDSYVPAFRCCAAGCRHSPGLGAGRPRGHGGALLPRHQPALRRSFEPAVAGGHHSSVGHRRRHLTVCREPGATRPEPGHPRTLEGDRLV